MRLVRLFVAFFLLSIQGVNGFLPFKKNLLPHTASATTTSQQQQQRQSRAALYHWRKRALLSIRQWNHRWIFSPQLSTERSSLHQVPEVFVRKSMPADMGRASRILADGFFKGKTNWLTYQWERLETYLSLESTFPKPNTPHVLFVACDSQSGQVLGMVELDARKKGKNKDTATPSKNNNNNDNDNHHGPYMCNVAVDEGHLRKGIATALIRQCEGQVQQWHVDSNGEIPCSLYLKVRANNEAAIRMYSKLDYYTQTNDRGLSEEWDPKTRQTIYVMRKELEKPSKSSSFGPVGMGDRVAERQPLPPF